MLPRECTILSNIWTLDLKRYSSWFASVFKSCIHRYKNIHPQGSLQPIYFKKKPLKIKWWNLLERKSQVIQFNFLSIADLHCKFCFFSKSVGNMTNKSWVAKSCTAATWQHRDKENSNLFLLSSGCLQFISPLFGSLCGDFLIHRITESQNSKWSKGHNVLQLSA